MLHILIGWIKESRLSGVRGGNDIATPQSVVTPSIRMDDAFAIYGLALDVVCKSVEAKIVYASQPISLRTGDL